MAKNTITRKSALSIAITALNYLNVEAVSIGGLTGDDYVEVADVLAHMLEQISKPRAKAVSKARMANENLAKWAVKHMPAEGLTTKGLVALGDPNIATTQKAAAVLRVAVELGLAEKVTDKRQIIYKPVAAE